MVVYDKVGSTGSYTSLTRSVLSLCRECQAARPQGPPGELDAAAIQELVDIGIQRYLLGRA
jgi:hypothetical protein